MRRRLLTLLVPLALAFASSAGFALGEGDRAPDFQARSVTGDAEVVLHKLRGKVVLVDFWASWCAPCNAAMPQLEKLSKEFPADQFVVLGVNVDKKLDDARRAIERRKVSYPNASDPTGSLP
jgi:thiol-disulfide isomerase/thioredoxin